MSTCIHMIDIYGCMYICLGMHRMQQTASARAALRVRRGNYPEQMSRLDLIRMDVSLYINTF